MAKKKKKQDFCEDCLWRNGERCHHPKHYEFSHWTFTGETRGYPVPKDSVSGKCTVKNDIEPVKDVLKFYENKPYWFIYYRAYEASNRESQPTGL